ncbi:MAG: hypothetical protein ACI89X_000093 [Planctomycetota bacterium]|jgi:hypothetical protein
MNKSSLLLSVFALVFALGAVMFFIGGDDSALPAPPSDDYFEKQDDDAASSAVVEASAEAASFEGAADEGELERSEVEIQVDDSPRLVIQVWDRKKGKIAPEAKVYVLEGYEGPEMSDSFAPHWCEVAIAKGTRYTATSEGRVVLPRLQKTTVIAATLPGSSGMTRLRKGHRETESVVLQAEETVTVRVTDQRGRVLANVPVGIQQRIPERLNPERAIKQYKELESSIAAAKKRLSSAASAELRVRSERRLVGMQRERQQLMKQLYAMRDTGPVAKKSKGKSPAPSKKVSKGKSPFPKKIVAVTTTKMDLKARRRTDAEGYAVFKHFQLYRKNASGWWPKQHQDCFEAVLMVPLAEPVRESFRGKPVPEDVIELRMPPTGSIALRTVDRDGRPFTHPVHGELRIIDGKNPKWARMPIRKEQNEREIVFPFVGLGMQLDASCRLDDNDFRWRAPVFAGPQQPGERLIVDLVVAPGAAMLYGRLLDASGVALANAKTTFLINSIRGRLEGEEVLLDDEGRFHLPYQLRGQHQPPWRLQVRYQERNPVPGLATTLGVLPKEGVMDIGDLQIGDLTRITFGRVVNDLGDEIPDARVQLQRQREVGSRARLSWQDEAFAVTTTDDDGQFSLFGDLEAGRYRLRVTAGEHFPYEPPNLPSRDGAVIKLDRRSRVVGSVLLPKWLSSRRVKVRLESQVDPTKGRDERIINYRGQKLIYFDWVKPGIYSLSLRLEDFPDAFVRVDGFEIKSGQRDMHPRLKDLDLARDLYRFEVFAIDEAGKRMNPKTPLRARVMRPDGSYAMVGFQWKGGHTEILTSQSSLEVLPEEPGFRSPPSTLIAGRNELRFTRVPAVTLQTPGLRQLVGEESVWISMELVEKSAMASFDSRSRRISKMMVRASSSHGRLNARDRASMRPLRDGRYRVIARLGDKRRGGLVNITLGEVDVRLVPGGQPNVFTVAVDTQAVMTAMQEVAQRRAAAEQRAASRPAGGRRGK